MLLLILNLSVAHPAFASVCRNYDDYDALHQHHQICILSINRSAKNHWEYKAAVSVDGLSHSPELNSGDSGIRQRLQSETV
jgi:hypothetical protein